MNAFADQAALAARFAELHRGPDVLLVPNPWDAGSARVLAHLGFDALATTSSGAAAARGRVDGGMTRAEAVADAAAIAAAVTIPVSADLEHGFADAPEEVARTIEMAIDAGLAGASIEDATGKSAAPIYDVGLAVARIEAAAAAAHSGPVRLVLTARAENHLHGHTDLDDTIRRLQCYQEAGADVLYAPGLRSIDDIRRVVTSLDKPVNVLAGAGVPPIAELAAAGVRRVSVGGAFAWVAMGALVDAARELREQGSYGFAARAAEARAVARAAFGAP
jgi:2-methylisocitrate lyase-like PEP mutase family enzyme